MNIGESLINSFTPEIYIKVARMEDGAPVPDLVREVYNFLAGKYETLVDTKKGVIYLRKKGATNV